MKLNQKERFEIDKTNKRLKIFDCTEQDLESFSRRMEELAKENELEKIILFGKNPNYKDACTTLGFVYEGKIDGFFDGKDAYMLSKFLTSKRETSDNVENEDQILTTIKDTGPATTNNELPEGYQIREAKPEDAERIVEIFNVVFKTYPSPMHNKDYVVKALKTNVDLVVIENEQGEIVSLSSAEMDFERKNAEITDCATLPSERGKGLMYHMIHFLEEKMQKRGILNLFSIARARSFGMNKVLYNHDYQYRGRLINNVHISGNWENMNIWVKPLHDR